MPVPPSARGTQARLSGFGSGPCHACRPCQDEIAQLRRAAPNAHFYIIPQFESEFRIPAESFSLVYLMLALTPNAAFSLTRLPVGPLSPGYWSKLPASARRPGLEWLPDDWNSAL